MIIPTTSIGGQRYGRIQNATGEIMPAFAATRPVSVGRGGVLLVQKPIKDDDNLVVFNGPKSLMPNGQRGDTGEGTRHYPTTALYNVPDGLPAVGEQWGTRAGFWQIFRGYEGLLIWGGARPDKQWVYVEQDTICPPPGGPGYYYSAYGYGATVCCCPDDQLPLLLCATVQLYNVSDTLCTGAPLCSPINYVMRYVPKGNMAFAKGAAPCCFAGFDDATDPWTLISAGVGNSVRGLWVGDCVSGPGCPGTFTQYPACLTLACIGPLVGGPCLWQLRYYDPAAHFNGFQFGTDVGFSGSAVCKPFVIDYCVRGSFTHLPFSTFGLRVVIVPCA